MKYMKKYFIFNYGVIKYISSKRLPENIFLIFTSITNVNTPLCAIVNNALMCIHALLDKMSVAAFIFQAILQVKWFHNGQPLNIFFL